MGGFFINVTDYITYTQTESINFASAKRTKFILAMKNILLILGFLACVFTVQAQQNELSNNVKKQLEVLKKADLNLSDVQLSRITTVLVGKDASFQKMLKALEGNKSLLQTRTAEYKADIQSNIKGAMSPQQAEKFDALKLGDKL